MPDKRYNILFLCTGNSAPASLMLALPIEKLDRLALERRVRDIGHT